MGSWGVHAQPGVATTLPRGFIWAEMQWQNLQTWGHGVWRKVGMNHRSNTRTFVNICILSDELLSRFFLPYPFPLPEFWQPGRKLGVSSLETWPKRKDSQMLSVGGLPNEKSRLIADTLCWRSPVIKIDGHEAKVSSLPSIYEIIQTQKCLDKSIKIHMPDTQT